MPYKYNLIDASIIVCCKCYLRNAFINVFLESFSERKNLLLNNYCKWIFGVTLQLVTPAPEQWVCYSGGSTKGQPGDLPPDFEGSNTPWEDP